MALKINCLMVSSVFFISGMALFLGCSSGPKSASKPEAVSAAPAAPVTKPKVAESAPAKAEVAVSDKKSVAKPKSDAMAGTASEAAGAVSCESGGDKRLIENKSGGQGCEVVYTKQGNPVSVAKSQHDLTYCSKTVTKIRENLEKSGFKCQ